MQIDVVRWIPTIFFSGLGYVYFTYGRRRPDFWFGFVGLILMGYGYAVHDMTTEIAIGIGLLAAPFVIKKIWFR